MTGVPANAQQIWTDLLNAGATPIEASGILGNVEQESSGNPEYAQPGVVGIVSWNPPNYGTQLTSNGGAVGTVNGQQFNLVTGNIANDIATQVAYLKATGAFQAADAATVDQSAINFQNIYERPDPNYECQSCRVTSAEDVYNMFAGSSPSVPNTPTGYVNTTPATGTTPVGAVSSGGTTPTSAALDSSGAPKPLCLGAFGVHLYCFPQGLFTRIFLAVVGLALLIVGANAIAHPDKSPGQIIITSPQVIGSAGKSASRKVGGASKQGNARMRGEQRPTGGEKQKPSHPLRHGAEKAAEVAAAS